MNWRFVARFLLALAVVGFLALTGTAIYQAGFAQGLAADGTVAAAPYPYYGWHPGGFGFGIFGFLGLLLFLFLLFGLARAAFGGGPRWGGPGYGRGWGGPGEAGRPHPWEDRARGAFDEWHRRAHEGESDDGGTGRTPPTTV